MALDEGCMSSCCSVPHWHITPETCARRCCPAPRPCCPRKTSTLSSQAPSSCCSLTSHVRSSDALDSVCMLSKAALTSISWMQPHVAGQRRGPHRGVHLIVGAPDHVLDSVWNQVLDLGSHLLIVLGGGLVPLVTVGLGLLPVLVPLACRSKLRSREPGAAQLMGRQFRRVQCTGLLQLHTVRLQLHCTVQ